MHDPKFERDVQERMEGLQFNPSDQVWTRLEQELNKEKRRPLPLFWLLLLVGGMLIGAGGTWFIVGRNANLMATHPAAPQLGVPQSDASPSQVSPSVTTQSTVSPSGASQSPVSPSVTSQSPVPSSAATRSPVLSSVAPPPIVHSGAPRARTPRPEMRHSATFRPMANTITAHRRPQHAAPFQPDDQTPIPERDLTASPIGTDLAILAPDPSRNYSIPHPPIGTSSSPARAHSLLAPHNQPANERTAKKASLNDHHHLWEAGFTGGVGVSSAEQGILRQPGSTFAALNLLSAPVTTGAYGGLAGLPSYINPKASAGPSFWAGIFVQRPIGRKISISAGLNLHYYSTRIITGQQVTGNSNYPTPSLFYLSAVASSSRSYPYYPAGDDYNYVNRYYFLELPLSIQWQFNRSNKLPLFFEGGLSAARMMSANALYYNESSGVYYKVGTPSSDPLQLFSSVSLLAGLHWGDTRIQFGPQFQYGLTSLLRSNAGPAEHLIYGGLKLTVVPGW